MSYNMKSEYIGDDKFMYGKITRNLAAEPKIVGFKHFDDEYGPRPKIKELSVDPKCFLNLTLQDDMEVGGVVVSDVNKETADLTGIRVGDRLMEVNGTCVLSFPRDKLSDFVNRQVQSSPKLRLAMREKEDVHL